MRAILTLLWLLVLPAQGETLMSQHTATGTFEVKLDAQQDANSPLGRWLLDKTFAGDLKGHSLGQMLAYGDPRSGSAGYVALEVFTGSLNGKEGGFALAHKGEMDQGQQLLEVSVVPGSGSGALKGISGRLQIDIKDGQHFYHFQYRLPEP